MVRISCIRNEYGEIRSIFPYSVRMRENTNQKNSEHGHFSQSTVCFDKFKILQSLSKKRMRSGKNCDVEKNEIDKHCWLEDHGFS